MKVNGYFLIYPFISIEDNTFERELDHMENENKM